MVEGGGHVHHAIDNDGRGFHGLQHLGLEGKFGPQIFHITRIDLLAGVVAGLVVIAVGMQPVIALVCRTVEMQLTDADTLGQSARSLAFLTRDFLGAGKARESANAERGGQSQMDPFAVLHSSRLLVVNVGNPVLRNSAALVARGTGGSTPPFYRAPNRRPTVQTLIKIEMVQTLIGYPVNSSKT